MTKRDYKELLLEVERWEDAEELALDRWEEARWKEYDEDPEGRYFDTIGDGAGARFSQIQSSVSAFKARIQEAEECDRNGDEEMAVQITTEVCNDLGISSDTWERMKCEPGLIDSAHKQASIWKWVVLGAILLSLIGTFTFIVLPLL